MELVHATSLLLSLAAAVVSMKITHTNTLFIQDAGQTKICLQENITLDVFAPSVVACTWHCATQTTCQWVRFKAGSRECLGCNASASAENESSELVTGAVYYEKATPCPTDWISVHGTCYLIVEMFLSWNTAFAHCQEHNSSAVGLDTREEHVQLIGALQTYTGNFWTSGSYFRSPWTGTNGWNWYASTNSFTLNDTMWGAGDVEEAEAAAKHFDDENPGVQRSPVCCLKREKDYRLSVCDRFEKMGVVCEAYSPCLCRIAPSEVGE